MYLQNISVTYTTGGTSTDPSITANDVDITYDATSGSIAYTVNNPVEGGVLSASTDSEWLTPGAVGETVPFTCGANELVAERTASVVLTYTYNTDQTVTKTVTVTQAGNPNVTMTIAEVREQETGEVATSGIVTSCSGTTGYIQDATAAICVYGASLTVGDNITVTGTLSTYNGLLEITSPEVVVVSSGNTVEPQVMTIETINSDYIGDNALQGWLVRVENATVSAISSKNVTLAQGENTIVARFNNTNEITFAVNDVVSMTANIGCYNAAQLANPTDIEVQANEDPVINAEDITLAYNATSGSIDYTITNPVEGVTLTATTTADWISNITVGDASVTFTTTANEGTEDRSASITLSYTNATDKVVAVTQGHYIESNNWELTNLADLTSGDVFVIVGTVDGYSYAMSNDNGTSGAPTATSVTIASDGDHLSGTIAENLQWNISCNATDGYTFYPAGSATTWLYCTNSNNGVRVGTGDAKHFTVSAGYLTTTETAVQRYLGIYNTEDWRCYTNTTGNIVDQTFAYYKKVSDDVNYTKKIAAYSGDGGYYLIASPVCSVVPSANNGFLTTAYDLYYFDQAQTNEWINYEAGAFNLTSGKGYLYASSTATTLTFTGQPYNGNGLVELTYTEGTDFAGWNLIGNPYATSATLDKAYYRLNAGGSEVNASTESSAVNAMEGVFVIAETDPETGVTDTDAQFTVGDSKNSKQLNLNVTKNRGNVIDRAIVRFDEGSQLPKFQLNAENTKVYIPQGNKDYAVVRSANEADMPVSFKASRNGSYTINVDTENVEMSYLHLIDNMTGADVDLLATPSYTFEANTSDYASRFRLVFKGNANTEENNDEPFAFFNGNAWVVNNMGEATLQLIDITGCILSSENVNGNATLGTDDLSQGVYVMRLVNGNNVKTQKIVVR